MAKPPVNPIEIVNESATRVESVVAVGLRCADVIAYSSALAAAIGALLTLVAAQAIAAPHPWTWAALAASGTFIIYNLDRLRDVERDRSTSPTRSSFVTRNRRRLLFSVVVVSAGFAAILMTVPPQAILLCVAIGLIGLFHRRLKANTGVKAAYVSIAWVVACVGLPWLASDRHEIAIWVFGIFLATVGGNLIATNMKDRESLPRRVDQNPTLIAARACLVGAIVMALAGPESLHALAWIPIFEGVTLIQVRSSERYRHLAIDGALLVGALAASVHQHWPT